MQPECRSSIETKNRSWESFGGHMTAGVTFIELFWQHPAVYQLRVASFVFMRDYEVIWGNKEKGKKRELINLHWLPVDLQSPQSPACFMMRLFHWGGFGLVLLFTLVEPSLRPLHASICDELPVRVIPVNNASYVRLGIAATRMKRTTRTTPKSVKWKRGRTKKREWYHALKYSVTY